MEKDVDDRCGALVGIRLGRVAVEHDRAEGEAAEGMFQGMFGHFDSPLWPKGMADEMRLRSVGLQAL